MSGIGFAPKIDSHGLDVSLFLELEDELGLFGKITLRDLDRDGSCLDPTIFILGDEPCAHAGFVSQIWKISSDCGIRSLGAHGSDASPRSAEHRLLPKIESHSA